jgi:hypothetical protein
MVYRFGTTGTNLRPGKFLTFFELQVALYYKTGGTSKNGKHSSVSDSSNISAQYR